MGRDSRIETVTMPASGDDFFLQVRKFETFTHFIFLIRVVAWYHHQITPIYAEG
jgi:hypothetical protein